MDIHKTKENMNRKKWGKGSSRHDCYRGMLTWHAGTLKYKCIEGDLDVLGLRKVACVLRWHADMGG